MLWLLCIPCTYCLPGIQFFGLLLMPLLASLSGPDTVLRFSLMLMVHSFVFAWVPSIVKKIPFLETIVFIVLIALPMNVVPSVVIWLYDKVIWTSEPILMVIEALSVVKVVTSISKMVVVYIQDYDLIVKSTILGVSIVSYSTAAFLWVMSYLYGGPSTRWVLFILLFLAVAMVIVTVYQDKGIISDCAVLTLYLLWCLWSMQQENKIAASPLKAPGQWLRSDSSHSSLVQIIVGLTSVRLESITGCIRFLLRLLAPTSILLILIRTMTVSYAVILAKNLTALDEQEDEGFYDSSDEDDDDGDKGEDRALALSALRSCTGGQKPRRLPIPFQLAFIFVFTQIIVYNVETLVKPNDVLSFFSIGGLNFQSFMIFHELRTFRLLQMVVCVVSYLWSLLREDELD